VPTVVAILLFLRALPLQGQMGEEPRLPSISAPEPAENDQGWMGPWGQREPDRLYGGLWALHLRRTQDGLSAHHLMGLSVRGVVAATFVNTHEGRSWVLGLGRSVAQAKGRDGGVRLGYRVGLLAGYDERLMDLAARYPVIPAFQIVADGRYRRLGVQVGWTWIVTYFGAFVSVDDLFD
jgi:hypothetical protein